MNRFAMPRVLLPGRRGLVGRVLENASLWGAWPVSRAFRNPNPQARNALTKHRLPDP
jgi:hypothetical protein